MTEAPHFEVGARVFKITQPDRVGIVVGPPRANGPVTFCPVSFQPPSIEYVVAENLALFEGGGVDALLDQGVFGDHAAFSRLITFTKLSIPLSDTLYAFLASRTDLYPYQYKPLIKFLESTNRRLLIADEVGLGKTIEAGLILIEQRMREELQRVLVVCPASLRAKWREELARRFDEHFTILDKDGLKRLLADVSERGGASAFRAIVSYGPVRSRDIIELLEAQTPPIDLLIVDEAHHLRNPGTLTHKGVRTLTEGSDAVLLLTATPIHLGSENLLTLLSLLDPEEFDRFRIDLFDRRLEANRHVVQAERLLMARRANLRDVATALRDVEVTQERDRFLKAPAYQEVLRRCEDGTPPTPTDLVELQSLLGELNVLGHVLSRSRKRDVQPERPIRNPHVRRVTFTPLEMEVYVAATVEARSTWKAVGSGSVDTFRAITRQRQVASCLPAALRRFQLLLAEHGVFALEEESDLDPDDWDLPEGPERPVPTGLVRFFNRIPDLERQDSKFGKLAETLQELEKVEAGRKMIIFSYFKDTLRYLQRRLTELGYAPLLLSGDVPSRPGNPQEDERAQLIKRFRDDEASRILLSSEVGSEGLDFQFCHIVVNYDLPWNPMVVEQRIGRLDRLGQKAERIIIVSLTVENTIEDRILLRLYDRIGIFRESIGDLEAILGDVVTELRGELLRSELTQQELDELVERKAVAIEIARKQEQILEEKSSELLGHDELFTYQLDQKRKLRQYVVPEELHVFVRQFLTERFPKATLDYDPAKGSGSLQVTEPLLALVRKHTPQGDPIVHGFIGKTFHGECSVTFDAERAAHDSDIEYLGPHHPLVQSIVREYEKHSEKLAPTAVVGLASRMIPAGEYFYSFDLIKVTGVRPRRYLDPVLVRLDSGDLVPEDESRQLVGAMVEEGCDVPLDLVRASADQLSMAREVARAEIGRRIDARRAVLARVNDQLADARLESLRTSHDAKRRAKSELLQQARERDRAPQYIRMLEGTIRNLDAAFTARAEEIEGARAFDAAYEPIAAGLLVVTGDEA